MNSSAYKPGSIASIFSSGKSKDEPDEGLATLFRKKFHTPKEADKEGNPPSEKKQAESIKRKIHDEEEDHVTEEKTAKKKKAVTESLKHPAERRIMRKRDPEQEARTIFCGNISVTVTHKSIMKLFQQFGKIESLRLRSAASADPKLSQRAAVIRKEFHEGKKNLNAYIVFEEKESAEKALSMNGVEFCHFHLRVDRAAAAKMHDQKKCVFVGNLPFDAAEDPLRKHFEECGEIDYVRLVRDKKTGVGKGIGYIAFESAAAVGLAVKLDGSEFMQRSIRVQHSSSGGGKRNMSREERRKEKKMKRKGGFDVSGQKEKVNEKNKKTASSTTPMKLGDYQGTKAVPSQQIKKKKVPTATLR